jgi:very-short-patch-repair endonuclease
MSRIHYKNYRSITLFARGMRKKQTPQEIVIWELLRKGRFLKYKFLRQHPVFYRIDKEWVDFYIADFYCNKLKMIIEVDGKIHDNRRGYDRERDAKLNAKGLTVIRIKNEKVNDISDLLRFLEEKITERSEYLYDNK